MIDYPMRESFFAIRFLRLLTKSAAAMHIGADGCMLLMIIVGQEDACRYSRPVSFWNHQLAALLGLRGVDEHALRRVRDRCVRAGWLQYAAGNKQLPARYFVTIPAVVSALPDSGSDESPEEYRANPAAISAQKRQESGENPAGIRQESGENPAPSSPNPPPIPTPKSAAAPPPAQAATAAADPLGMDSMQAAPAPRPHVPPKNFADWRAEIATRIFWTRDEDETWKAVFAAEGWDEMTKGYRHLAALHPPPKKIFLSMFQELRA